MEIQDFEKQKMQDAADKRHSAILFERDRLRIEKIIYSGRPQKTESDIKKIIELAIETHLGKHPDLELNKVEKSIKNPDRSVTIPIQFTYKSKS